MEFSPKVYRICKTRYAEDLKGVGAYHVGGRWNSPGKYMLYTSTSISLSMLEILAHVTPNTWPEDMSLVKINIPTTSIKILKPEDLEPEWRRLPVSYYAQKIGDDWIQSLETLILAVPSVINTEEYNYLINPAHPLFEKVNIEEAIPWSFDPRLSKVAEN